MDIASRAMTITQSEAEKLARTARALMGIERTTLDGVRDGIIKLCDHILTGSMKREIENAAFERAIKHVITVIEAQPLGLFGERYEPEEAPINRQYLANFMRNLIQPPVQPEGK